MTLLCQACEHHPSSIEEPVDDPNEPYLLCKNCHKRLINYSLRPLEWFNLAKRHGWTKFLLHDDFYDDDGSATQPEEEVEESANYPAPSLRQFQETPEALLDYSLTRWNLEDDVLAAWLRLPSDRVMSCITKRFDSTRNPTVHAVTLEVAALFGNASGSFVLHAWDAYPECGPFWLLAAATAACLPEEEGFRLVTAALETMPENERRQRFGALAHFRSTRSLEWIESNADAPIVDAWGHLAAASRLSWPQCEKWLKAGRPQSLIVVDALLAIADPLTPYLRKIRPTLENPPDEHDLRKAIMALMEVDSSPRVKQRATGLLNRLSALSSSD